jgi:hypothetical protein
VRTCALRDAHKLTCPQHVDLHNPDHLLPCLEPYTSNGVKAECTQGVQNSSDWACSIPSAAACLWGRGNQPGLATFALHRSHSTTHGQFAQRLLRLMPSVRCVPGLQQAVNLQRPAECNMYINVYLFRSEQMWSSICGELAPALLSRDRSLASQQGIKLPWPGSQHIHLSLNVVCASSIVCVHLRTRF